MGEGAVHAYSQSLGAATLCIGAASFLWLLANLDSVEHLKGFGVEARLRKLDERIIQADDSLQHMRILSKTMGQITFETLARIGRWSGPPSRAWQLEVAKSLKRHMEEIGIDPLAIEEAMEPWHMINLRDIAAPTFQAVFDVLREHQMKWENERSKYPIPLAPDDPKYTELTRMVQLYGDQITRLRERWDTDHSLFVKNAEDIIQSLDGVSAQVKKALLECTAADRKAASYYAQHHQFLSESKWLLDQPKE